MIRHLLSVVLVALAALCAASGVVLAEASEPVRAYRDIYFGMSREEVDAAVNEDGALSHSSTRLRPSMFGASTDVAGKRYFVNFDFFDDQLYRVSFTGPRYDATRFAAAMGEVSTLAEIIKKTYGEPWIAHHLTLHKAQMGLTVSHIWTPDQTNEPKRFVIGISEYNLRYSPYMVVISTTLDDARERAEEEGKQDSITIHSNDF